jgi:hypothetical protein
MGEAGRLPKSKSLLKIGHIDKKITFTRAVLEGSLFYLVR